MNKALKKYALLAEIISSIIVVASLIFLVFEIRENTRILKRTSYDSITESLIEWRRDLYTDPVLIEILRKIENGESLSAMEQSVFEMMGVGMYQNYERAFWANKYDHMGSSEWERFERMICVAKDNYWSERAARYSTADFVELVESCDN